MKAAGVLVPDTVGHVSSGQDGGFSWASSFLPMSFLFPSCGVRHPRHWPSPRLFLEEAGLGLASGERQTVRPSGEHRGAGHAFTGYFRVWHLPGHVRVGGGPVSLEVLQAPSADTVMVGIGPVWLVHITLSHYPHNKGGGISSFYR